MKPEHATTTPIAHRVLVVSADMGGGHNATAAALEEGVAQRWPGSAIYRIDALDLLGPGIGRLFRSIYVGNVSHTPWLYEFFYASLWRHRWFADASKRFTGTWCGRRLVSTIDRIDPDLIVSTYPIGSSGLAWLRRHRGLPVPTGAWVSDFAPHPFWIYRDLDVNVVMHDSAIPLARAAEPGARVEVGPLTVRRRFRTAPHDARRDAHVRPDAFVVVVSCGSYAFGDVTAMVKTLLAADPRLQVVAVCGHHAGIKDQLERLGVPTTQLSVRGWEDDMPDLLAAADLVVTNAGGATALEALACGTAIMMYEPIAAHGRANAVLMAHSGLAELCSSADQLTHRIRTMIDDRSAVAALRDAARGHADRTDLSDSLGHLASVGVHSRGPRPWPMRGQDAFFCHVENATVRQEPGLICRVAPDPDGRPLTADTVRARLADVARSVPALRRVITPGARPGWRVQRDLDPYAHVRSVVLPEESRDHDGGRSAAVARLEQLWSEPLPPGRPPWQILMVTGLPDGSAWLGLKMHHAALDGISGLGLVDRLFSPADGHAPVQAGGDPTVLLSARDPLPTRVRTAAATVAGVAGLARLGPAPRHPINTEITTRHRRLITWSRPGGELSAVAHALRSGPHELALCVIADAIRQMLVPAGMLRADRPLRVMVPMNLRSTRLDRVSGNWTGSVPIDVPLGPMPFPARLREVRDRLRRQVRQGQPRGAHAIMRIAGRLPPAAHAFVAQHVYGGTFVNVIATYLPGPRGRRLLAGHEVTDLFPVLPLAPGVPVAAGVITYRDRACFGLDLDAGLGIGAAAAQGALDASWAEAVLAAGVGTRGRQPVRT